MFDKRQIARQFDRSAASYGNFDSLQRLMNDELLAWLPTCQRIADLGCGNGRALAQIARSQPNTLRVGVDLSAGMLKQTRLADSNAQVVQGDIERLPLENRSFDLVYSCAALQWSQPDQSLCEIRRILQPDGRLLLGTLVAGSLSEWHQAWQIAGDASRVHQLPSAESISQSLVEQGFRLERSQCFEHALHYSSPEAMLKDLKGLGGTHAGRDRPRGLLGKNTYRRFREALLGLGCTARYQILLVDAVRT